METRHERFRYAHAEEFKAALSKYRLNLPFSENLGVLAKPLELGGKTIKNRLGIQPMEGCDGTLEAVRRVSDYQIPFVVLRTREDGGTVLSADTLTNGWDLSLSAYAYADEYSYALRPLTDAECALFLEILDSLEPLPD